MCNASVPFAALMCLVVATKFTVPRSACLPLAGKDRHYAKKRKELAIFHKVTLRQLARNHFVLDLFSGDAEKFTVNLSALKDLGFDPNFITGMEHNKYGHKYKLFNYCWYPANTQNTRLPAGRL